MVIRPLGDCIYYAGSALTHLGLCRMLYDCSLHHFTASYQMGSLDIFVDLQLFGCNSKGGIFDPGFGLQGGGVDRGLTY